MSKRPVIKCMNDLFPIAFTAVPMNVRERLFLKHLRPLFVHSLDSLHFTYTANHSCEGAILVLLQHLYPHLEHSGSSARDMFFIFLPHLAPCNHTSYKKLIKMDISIGIIHWILAYLASWTQFVCLDRNCCSCVITTNTGAQQRTVLVTIFTLYTADCIAQDVIYPLIILADETAMMIETGTYYQMI